MKEYPYWWDTVSRESAVPGPESPLRSTPYDVAIVGGGYTGLAAARRLARSGASVVVVEREWAGWGASSRNGGQVITGLRLDAATLIAAYGESRASRLFEVANAAIVHLEALVAEESIACEYARTGHIQAAWKPKHFEAFRAEQAVLARVFAHRVELVPRADQRQEIGTSVYHGLLVDERSGALNPAQLVAGLAAAARRAGACVIEGVAVRSLSREPGGWRIATSAGEITGRDVLVATNGYTNGAAPALQRRLVPIGSYILATEPLPAVQADATLPKRRVAFDSKHFLYYFRLTAERRLLFGGRAEFSRPTPASTRRAAAVLRRGMTTIFPELATTTIDYAWGGNVAFTRDQLPHAGSLDGMYYAGGYAGHGIAMATHLGDLIARRIGGERVAHPLIDAPFPAIPFYHGTPWFLPVAGAYYRFADWIS